MLLKQLLMLPVLLTACLVYADDWPALPESNGHTLIPAQDWPHRPGPRTVKVYVYFPGGSLSHINAETGLMLTCHNWGGTNARGAPNPEMLVKRYNVVAIAVDYLQSGDYKARGDEPYDHGYLQALDVLRALWWVRDELQKKNISFAQDRIYATGGSGGGNVSLMANKLAPRTFACVIAFSAMPRLTDDVAFGLEGGSYLNAGYSKNPNHPYYLHPAAQDIRDIGNPTHAKTMVALGNEARIIIVHGAADEVCLTGAMDEVIENLKKTTLNLTYHRIDNTTVQEYPVYKNTGHSIGDRTQMLFHVADPFLKLDNAAMLRCATPSDSESRDQVQYTVPGGTWIIDYRNGYPVGQLKLDTSPKD